MVVASPGQRLRDGERWPGRGQGRFFQVVWPSWILWICSPLWTLSQIRSTFSRSYIEIYACISNLDVSPHFSGLVDTTFDTHGTETHSLSSAGQGHRCKGASRWVRYLFPGKKIRASQSTSFWCRHWSKVVFFFVVALILRLVKRLEISFQGHLWCQFSSARRIRWISTFFQEVLMQEAEGSVRDTRDLSFFGWWMQGSSRICLGKIETTVFLQNLPREKLWSSYG